MGIEQGKVHGAVYRSAFGESIRDHAVEGAGFSIQNGEFVAVSRVFNTPSGGSASQETMTLAVKETLITAVNEWKAAGEMQGTLTANACQNFTVDSSEYRFGHGLWHDMAKLSLNNSSTETVKVSKDERLGKLEVQGWRSPVRRKLCTPHLIRNTVGAS